MAKYFTEDELIKDLDWLESLGCESLSLREMKERLEYGAVKPAADVAPVVHGNFEPVSDDDHDEGQFYCSVCGAPEFFLNGVPLSKYCYNCGAKMDSKEETNA